MNGKDVFLCLNDIGDDLIARAEYGQFPTKAEQHVQPRRWIRRPFLIAAIVSMLLLLVGCAVVYVLSMKQINIGQQEVLQDVFDYDPESGQAVAYLGQETVTEDVLTLAGLQGSRNYRAAQEWFTFKQAYDPDSSIFHQLQSAGGVPEFPAEYEAYRLYSQEMLEKLEEILEKYHLNPIGRTIPFKTEELVCRALGLERMTVPGSKAVIELDFAEYQECGNLSMDFSITIPGEAQAQQTRCHLYYLRKDAFTENVILLREMETWKEWTYKTDSGTDVLIFRSPSDCNGYVFCDMPDATVTLRYTFISQQHTKDGDGNWTTDTQLLTDREIELLADEIDFSIAPKLAADWEDQTAASASGDSIDGYCITLRSVESDGIHVRITLGITAPEGTNLLELEGAPISLKHSNRWGFFEPESGSGNVSGGYKMEEDGDGKANTQNVVLDYNASLEEIRAGKKPFASGLVWNIYWQDLYASYLDENTNEPEQYLLVEGTWSFDVIFDDVIVEELELITTPVASKASYGWDMQGNDLYRDTAITSFILRPMSASIICDMEDAAPDFLTVGEGCAYVILKDGSKLALYADSAGAGVQNLRPESRIPLDDVASVLLPDGTEIKAPEA